MLPNHVRPFLCGRHDPTRRMATARRVTWQLIGPARREPPLSTERLEPARPLARRERTTAGTPRGARGGFAGRDFSKRSKRGYRSGKRSGGLVLMVEDVMIDSIQAAPPT